MNYAATTLLLQIQLARTVTKKNRLFESIQGNEAREIALDFLLQEGLVVVRQGRPVIRTQQWGDPLSVVVIGSNKIRGYWGDPVTIVTFVHKKGCISGWKHTGLCECTTEKNRRTSRNGTVRHG